MIETNLNEASFKIMLLKRKIKRLEQVINENKNPVLRRGKFCLYSRQD